MSQKEEAFFALKEIEGMGFYDGGIGLSYKEGKTTVRCLVCHEKERIDMYTYNGEAYELKSSLTDLQSVTFLKPFPAIEEFELVNVALGVTASSQIFAISVSKNGLKLDASVSLPTTMTPAHFAIEEEGTYCVLGSTKGELFVAALTRRADSLAIKKYFRYYIPHRVSGLCFTDSENLAIVRDVDPLLDIRVSFYQVDFIQETVLVSNYFEEITAKATNGPSVILDVFCSKGQLVVIGFDWMKIYLLRDDKVQNTFQPIELLPMRFARVLGIQQRHRELLIHVYFSYETVDKSHSSLLATFSFDHRRDFIFTIHLRNLEASFIERSTNGLVVLGNSRNIRIFDLEEKSELPSLNTCGKIKGLFEVDDKTFAFCERSLYELRPQLKTPLIGKIDHEVFEDFTEVSSYEIDGQVVLLLSGFDQLMLVRCTLDLPSNQMNIVEWKLSCKFRDFIERAFIVTQSKSIYVVSKIGISVMSFSFDQSNVLVNFETQPLKCSQSGDLLAILFEDEVVQIFDLSLPSDSISKVRFSVKGSDQVSDIQLFSDRILLHRRSCPFVQVFTLEGEFARNLAIPFPDSSFFHVLSHNQWGKLTRGPMRSFALRVVDPSSVKMGPRRPTYQKTFTEEEVRDYKNVEKSTTRHEKFAQADKEDIRKYLKSRFEQTPMYDFMSNVWKNKMIARKKKRENQLRNIASYPPVEPAEPKFVVHSPLYTHIDIDADLRLNTFFVVTFKDRQYKLLQDDVVFVSRMNEAKVGDLIEVDQVNLLANKYFTLLGRPLVPSAKVTLVVEEQTFADRLIVLKKKRRKGYRRSINFEHAYTRLRVAKMEFEVPEEVTRKAISLI